MTPFDDRLPEEQERQYEELIALLHQAYRPPVTVDQATEEQILARVRERLGFTDVEQVGVIESIPQHLESTVVLHKRRLFHLVALIAAVVILGLLLAPELLLFRPPPTSIVAQAAGLEMSLRVTPGPYFLSEMLAVDVSLTNHSRATYQVVGLPPNLHLPCHNTELRVELTDGTSPYDSTLKQNLTAVLCPSSDNGPRIPLFPNQTIRWRHYVALTSSGHVTLTAKVVFASSPVSPLEGHWPSLQLVVDPSIPPDRVITAQQHGNQIIISAPQEARGQLLYLSTFECVSSPGTWSSRPPSDWQPLRMLQFQPLPPQDCSSPTELWAHWTYVVGAPGYATVSGKYP